MRKTILSLTLGAFLSLSSPALSQPLADNAALPLREASRLLIEATLRNSQLFDDPDARRVLVLDPLIDRVTGFESNATRVMEGVAAEVIREQFPQISVQPFTNENLAKKPLILLGCITQVQGPGSMQQAVGAGHTYRIWAVLLDTRTNRIVSHPTAWVKGEVDLSPVPFHRDSPLWALDPAQEAYVRTTAAPVGAEADPEYLESLGAEAKIQQGMQSFLAGKAEESARHFADALQQPRGRQLRSFNGLYLAHIVAGNQRGAAKALDQVMEFGAQSDNMVLKVLFRPGMAAWSNAKERARYEGWLRRFAVQMRSSRDRCTLVAGHASPTGVARLNDILALRRAEFVRNRILEEDKRLANRVEAQGFGSSQNLVGFGTDNWQDVLDRRVEFRPTICP